VELQRSLIPLKVREELTNLALVLDHVSLEDPVVEVVLLDGLGGALLAPVASGVDEGLAGRGALLHVRDHSEGDLGQVQSERSLLVTSGSDPDIAYGRVVGRGNHRLGEGGVVHGHAHDWLSVLELQLGYGHCGEE